MAVAMAAVLANGCSSKKSDEGSSSPAVSINGVTWYVQLATTPEQQRRGLSGRRDLPGDEGMLFIFDHPQELKFWMQGCLMPIDVAYIGEDMRVVSVRQMNVEPDLRGRTIYPSEGNALYALEVAGGILKQARVKPGDLVTFSGIRK
jgi:uncharacterized membrane protein (UPF0127 family)